MRIRIIKMIFYEGGHYHVGDVADVPDSVAHEYIRKGLAMQDKSVQPTEIKEKPQAAKIVRRRRK